MSPLSSKRSARGFTLVEMLVVMGIIAVLIALLMPAVMIAVNSARRARIATEVNALSQAVETYKSTTGDYPPNFRQYAVVMRHIRRAYPNVSQPLLDDFVVRVWGSGYNTTTNIPPVTVVPNIDEGEALVFWLYLIDTDPRDPFKATRQATVAGAINAAQSPKRYYPFDEQRLVSEDGDIFPSYRAVFSRDSFYVYIDSRSYQYFMSDFSDPKYAAYAELTPTTASYDKVVRPYYTETASGQSVTGPPVWPNYKPQSATTFQLICASQDGDFGQVDSAGNEATDGKFLPGGGNFFPGDRDNITNFSDGRRLEDLIQN
ncbi:MAG: type II secretion system protein [Pirellulaceae bacterium]|nr:type II secretion system protein [Pirellulaceae bacterium]